MALKLIISAAFVACVAAQYYQPQVYAPAPVLKKVVAEPPPHDYSFAYGVNDPHKGDVHDQQETREGGVVKGSYSLIETDGTRRIVHYTADPHNGFNAVVQHEGTPNVAAPVYAKAAAPLAGAYYH